VRDSDRVTGGSGRLVPYHALWGTGLSGAEIGRETVQCRAIRADDFAIVAEIKKDVRMIEWWIGPDAHEFLRADFNNGDAGIVMEVGDYVIRHAFHLKSLRDIDAPITQRDRAAPYWSALRIPRAFSLLIESEAKL
jgi:hypothetical protein